MMVYAESKRKLDFIREGVRFTKSQAIKPITVDLVRKPMSIDNLRTEFGTQKISTRCVIQAMAEFNEDSWIKFKNGLGICTVDGFEKFGGLLDSYLAKVVKCTCAERAADPPIYVNPEGYNYARYAGFDSNRGNLG